MNRMTLLLALLGATALTSGAEAKHGRTRNLLHNPGFELGEGGTEYWEGVTTTRARRWSQFQAAELPAHGGRISQRIRHLLLKDADHYRLSAMFRSDDRIRVTISVEYETSAKVPKVVSVRGYTRAGQWTCVAGRVELPKGLTRATLVVEGAGVLVDEVGLQGVAEVGNYPQGFPLPQSFRGMDGGAKALADYADFPLNNEYGRSNCEELRSTYPRHTVIKQIAFGTIIKRSEQQPVYPGFWLYYRGTKVKTKVDAKPGEAFTLRVANPERVRSFVRNGATRYPDAAIVPLVGGKPEFSQALHVQIDGASGNQLSCVALHAYPNSDAPPAFAKNAAVLLPHVPWRGNSSWELNLDPAGPRFGGQNAIEYYVDWIADAVEGLNGVQFDLPYWHYDVIPGYELDIDNDLVPDDGFKNGVNVYGLGLRRFAHLLRQALGPDALINFDGEPDKIRSWGSMDGIQIERFVQKAFDDSGDHQDDYMLDRFGFQFDHLRNTVSRLNSFRQYSYAQCFADSSRFSVTHAGLREPLNPFGRRDHFLRVGLAANTLLGLPHSYTEKDRDWVEPDRTPTDPFWPIPVDQYRDGAAYGWLGRPVTPLAQKTLQLESLVKIADWQMTLKTQSGYRATVLKSGDDRMRSHSVRVDRTPSGRPAELGVELVTGSLPRREEGEEYTLVFEARGDTDWSYSGTTFHSIPRAIKVGGLKALSTKATKVLVGRRWHMYVLSFRSARTTSDPIRFGLSEQIGTTEIRKVRLFKGSANRFVREFAGGVVLLNMSDSRWTYPGLPTGGHRVVPTRSPCDYVDGSSFAVPRWDGVLLAKQ